MLVEVVHSIEEFIGKVDPSSDVHYEIESNIIGPIGDIAYVKLTLYGIGRNSVVKCVLVESARWNDKDVRKHRTGNAIDDLKLWIKEKRKEMEKIARELKATPGKYEVLAWNAGYAV
ncbi:hypothetical protein DRP05_00900 [Archaeoglobales archaeon]|nr:MAG: hypothetical protein DRP05_00900 [Archaeoglobales archaeon]